MDLGETQPVQREGRSLKDAVSKTLHTGMRLTQTMLLIPEKMEGNEWEGIKKFGHQAC